jgi:hypothetical protein
MHAQYALAPTCGSGRGDEAGRVKGIYRYTRAFLGSAAKVRLLIGRLSHT